MRLVIDANIVIAMLIRPGKPVDLLFSQDLEVFAPELLFVEIENNVDTIIKKSYLEYKEILEFIRILRNNVTVVSEKEFLNFRNKAETTCPDPKDVTYFALALHLKCSIWSNENKLKEQNEIKVYKTHELINLFLP